jgi:hypothetical protein
MMADVLLYVPPLPVCGVAWRTDVRGSLVGFLVVTSLFAVWTLVFLLFREEMGPAGDSISLLVPKGP